MRVLLTGLAAVGDLDGLAAIPAARRAADRLPISSAGTARETRAHRSPHKYTSSQ